MASYEKFDASGDIAEKIAEYYRGLFPDREDLSISGLEEITAGWEAELYSFVVEHEEEGRRVREERVIRLYLGDLASQKASSEFKVISRLFEAGYPVPEVFHMETDASALGGPFIVMERVRGRNMSEALVGASEEESRALMEVFTRIWVDLHSLEVLAIGRRLMDVSVSFAVGAEKLGMRAGAVEMMGRSSDHLHRVYELLKERTGLRLPEFEEILDSLRARKFDEGDR